MKQYINIPSGLNPPTRALVCSFAEALAEKLHAAEKRYGYSDGWQETAWIEDGECAAKFREHVEKGDPRDVAAYCAFLWYHEASTKLPSAAPTLTPADAGGEPKLRIVAAAVIHGGVVHTAPHHHLAMWQIACCWGEKAHGQQGFVASDGEFYEREAARVIAEAAGQIRFPLAHKPAELFSEELWSYADWLREHKMGDSPDAASPHEGGETPTPCTDAEFGHFPIIGPNVAARIESARELSRKLERKGIAYRDENDRLRAQLKDMTDQFFAVSQQLAEAKAGVERLKQVELDLTDEHLRVTSLLRAELSRLRVAQQEYQIDGENLNSLRAQLNKAKATIENMVAENNKWPRQRLKREYHNDGPGGHSPHCFEEVPVEEHELRLLRVQLAEAKAWKQRFIERCESFDKQEDALDAEIMRLRAQLATHPGEEAVIRNALKELEHLRDCEASAVNHQSPRLTFLQYLCAGLRRHLGNAAAPNQE